MIGAGAAGLAALRDLERAGLSVVCLEARDRIGGRILTLRDPQSPVPIELGAEFIHGRPPEIWNLIDSQGLCAYDCNERALHIKDGRIEGNRDAWLMVDKVMEDMQSAAETGPDRSFQDFLQGTSHPEDSKQLATSYVEGFNAARAEIVGIQALAIDAKASDKIDGDRAWRIMNGYDAIPGALWRSAAGNQSKIRLNTIAVAVDWKAKQVRVSARSALTNQPQIFEARHIIVTVPLGVLQAEPGTAGSIRFSPEPGEVLAAARDLCFGQVIRVVLRFDERVWEQRSELADAGFLLSQEPVFPTWWTPLPCRAPIITGWSAGPKADSLLNCSREEVIAQALARLQQVMNVDSGSLQACLQGSYFHDWHADPFARGAYSYVPAGKLPAREALARPLQETLFFAGEANEMTGHSATVHGAIISGQRAAAQLIGCL